jgi:hypothetical protein
LDHAKREDSVALNKLYAMVINATVSTRTANGEEHQPNVVVEM